MLAMKNLDLELSRIKNAWTDALATSKTLDELEEVRITFLGRKGEIATLMPLLKNASDDEKRLYGPVLNAFKELTEREYTQKKETLFDAELEKEEEKFKHFDVTAYLPAQARGSIHPYTHATERIQDIFISMGYGVVDGPEIDTEFYNFEALNIPKNHPARDMQDTFFIDAPEMVMRTHTSSVQIRAMQTQKPPLAIITTGRVYRHEATDASHDYMFRQFEGLVVNKDISMANLIATMKLFLQEFFEKKDLTIRVRPSYFPFVEPAVEIDMSCPFCEKGCSTCKHSTWIEIVGGGLVHPRVLTHGGIDPTEYSGFAFGFGLTRLVMLKYGINDIRLLHCADLNFLKQF